MSSVQNSVDTVNAAATAIFTSGRRAQPSSVQRKRWASFRSLYSCFGSHKHTKRISHAVLVSEPSPLATVHPSVDNPNHRSSAILLPFIVPPSSPASFLQSDPPSATHTPIGLLSVHAYSPTGTQPIFTIGPYAYETQLVSPPVFSTFTTEPSTAPLTPPTETTTPSSPEVPFAELLSSSLARNRRNAKCEFIGYGHFSNYDVASLANSDRESQNGDHRVSFELIGEDIPICVVKENVPPRKIDECEIPRTVSVGSSKDFDFDNSKEEEEEEEVSDKSSIDCEWWTSDESVVTSKGYLGGHRNKWTFFRVLQSGVG
ncbi:uncharacterized protein at1g76660 [Phtheirospermum japonicum]|uniref:Uncharacterized protein at1g76660 n=1 Tax=Phtheirospermum japonicum TaxID=374723 RepID=A0A830BJJ2_9LAMI|nr:uncharacterized protein at1g76660 [Phtheirospermum japonicum]